MVAATESVAVKVATPAAFSAIVVVPDNVTVGNAQFSVRNCTCVLTDEGHPGTGTEYVTLTVVFPVPVNDRILPLNEAGPVSEKVPPVGSAVISMEVPLQYNPPGLKTGVPEIATSTLVAPQINTTAVAKV